MRQSQREHQRWWLALSRVPRIGGSASLKLLQQTSLPELFSLSTSQLRQRFRLSEAQANAIASPEWSQIDATIDWCSENRIKIIVLGGPGYPIRLKEITSPPQVLFARGKEALLESLQLAVVGARSPSVTGRQNCRTLVKGVVETGLTITSGLALGIDACAHQTALENNGNTIAVLGSGLAKVYPARNRDLARQILEQGGLLLSEFWPNTPPKPEHFPRRNRVVSGLSLGTLVVEAAEKSGSLITARLALEQGREVFAVPGAVGNPMARGCHWLIKQGAKLVETPVDIMEEFALMLPHHTDNVSLSDEVNAASHLPSDDLLDNLGDEATPIDIIVMRTKLSVDVVLQRLLELEMQGLVAAVPGGYMRLRRTGHV